MVEDSQTVPEEDNRVVARNHPGHRDVVVLRGDKLGVPGVYVDEEQPGGVVRALRTGRPGGRPHHTDQPRAVLQPHGLTDSQPSSVDLPHGFSSNGQQEQPRPVDFLHPADTADVGLVGSVVVQQSLSHVGQVLPVITEGESEEDRVEDQVAVQPLCVQLHRAVEGGVAHDEEEAGLAALRDLQPHLGLPPAGGDVRGGRAGELGRHLGGVLHKQVARVPVVDVDVPPGVLVQPGVPDDLLVVDRHHPVRDVPHLLPVLLPRLLHTARVILSQAELGRQGQQAEQESLGNQEVHTDLPLLPRLQG